MGPEQAVALRVSAPATGAAENWSCPTPVPPFISVKFLDFQAVHTSTAAVLDLLTGGEFFGCSIIKVDHIAKPFEKSTYGYHVSPFHGVASYAPNLLPLLVHHIVSMKTQKCSVLPFT